VREFYTLLQHSVLRTIGQLSPLIQKLYEALKPGLPLGKGQILHLELNSGAHSDLFHGERFREPRSTSRTSFIARPQTPARVLFMITGEQLIPSDTIFDFG
jgi:hypothetical protein